MKTIPPVSVFLINKLEETQPKENRPPTPKEVELWMIEFAKMHVTEALKQASEKVSLMVTTYCGRSHKTLHTGKKFTYNNDDYVEINVKRILDAYSFDNVEQAER